MPGQHVTPVTDANFDAEVLQSDVPVLVDFWANWCAPCKALAPHLDTLAVENTGKLKVVSLDVQTNMKIASAYKISNIPALMVFKGGKLVGTKVGANGGLAALRTLVQNHL